jgi:hypothetical protein
MGLEYIQYILSSIAQPLFNLINSIQPQLQQIVNTGQGIVTGLTNFGAFLWDSLIKAFNTLGQWFYQAFQWISSGLYNLGNTLGQWFNDALKWIADGISWIASQLYNFGMWIYNGLVFIWNWIVNALKGVWDAIVGFFSGVASAISNWWSGVVNTVNSYITSLLMSIRRKLVQVITADVSIYFGWRSIEKFIASDSVSGKAMSILGVIASPFVGYLFANIIESLVSPPSESTLQIIPSVPILSYTPPSITIETPTERTAPTAPTPPVYTFTPLVEKAYVQNYSYDYDMTRVTTENYVQNYYVEADQVTINLADELYSQDYSIETELTPP